MSRGKRYNGEQKLNLKKVFAVIITIIVIIMFFMGIKHILKKDKNDINNFTEISYFTAYNNGKWGVINSNGDSIIEPAYDEMIVIPNSKKDVFLCLYDVNYSDGTYKTKAINSKNEQLFTSYTSVEPLSNYNSNKETWYETTALKVQKDGKYGLINIDGNEILSCIYDKVDTIKGIKNSILIQKDGLYGVVNATGNIIIEPQYSDIQGLTDEYTNGYIVKNSENSYGVIGVNKEQILDCKYSDIKHVYGNDMYVVKENGKWKIISKDGTTNTEISYDDVTYINSNCRIIKNKDKYGISGIDKTEKVKAEYQDCLVGTKNNDEKSYLIDRNLQLKLQGTNLTVYEGYIRLNIDNQYKFYNLKFEEKSNRDVFSNNTLYSAKNDGKYGLVNKDGTLVVQYQYDDIIEQNEYGFVAVCKDGKWGVIDQYGNTVIEPKYEFSDITKITVVGKWHSAEGVNTTYFICE